MVQKIKFASSAAFVAMVFTSVCLLTGFSSCDSKAPVDTDIEGFWQLEYFETAADGQRHDCERMFFGITRYVVEVAEKQGTHGYGYHIGRFSYLNGRTQVEMSDFKHRGNTSDDHTDSSVEELLPFGMNARTTVFDVVSANGKKLILRSDYATLYLSKF